MFDLNFSSINPYVVLYGGIVPVLLILIVILLPANEQGDHDRHHFVMLAVSMVGLTLSLTLEPPTPPPTTVCHPRTVPVGLFTSEPRDICVTWGPGLDPRDPLDLPGLYDSILRDCQEHCKKTYMQNCQQVYMTGAGSVHVCN